MKNQMLVAFVFFTCIVAAGAQGPEIHIEPESSSLQSSTGRHTLIKCHVSGVPNADVFWKRDDKVQGTNGFLMWTSPTEADSGSYVCHAQVGGWSDTKSIQMDFVEQTKFIESPAIVNPVADTDARIECKVNKEETANIFWTLDGNPLLPSDRFEFAAHKTVLIIKNFTTNDNGNYTCNLAQDFNNIDTRTIRVSAFVGPVISNVKSSEAVYEGQNAKFVCHFSGIPAPNVTWMRATATEKAEQINATSKYIIDTTNNSSTLTIQAVSLADTANYTCATMNAVGVNQKTSVLFVNSKLAVAKPLPLDKADKAHRTTKLGEEESSAWPWITILLLCGLLMVIIAAIVVLAVTKCCRKPAADKKIIVTSATTLEEGHVLVPPPSNIIVAPTIKRVSRS